TFFFFFSSRRRHTISDRDWSSDVCSSDLIGHPLAIDARYGEKGPLRIGDLWSGSPDPDTVVLTRMPLHALSLRVPHPSRRGWLRSEERRVGKECRSRRALDS